MRRCPSRTTTVCLRLAHRFLCFGGALLVFATTASLLAGNELEAAVIGHHDGTTASATWGWACDTANPEHRVTVVLTALVDGVLTEIGTATADRSRSDVAHAKACGATADANHGFVFTHYPQSVVDGRSHDIYAYARMPDGSLRLLSASPQNLSLVPRGIWDQGLIDGRWRTDYFDPATASAREPLLLDAGPDAQCWLSAPPFVGGGASPFGTGCLTFPDDLFRLERGKLGSELRRSELLGHHGELRACLSDAVQHGAAESDRPDFSARRGPVRDRGPS